MWLLGRKHLLFLDARALRSACVSACVWTADRSVRISSSRLLSAVARVCSAIFMAFRIARKWFISRSLPAANQYIRAPRPTNRSASGDRRAIGAVTLRRRGALRERTVKLQRRTCPPTVRINVFTGPKHPSSGNLFHGRHKFLLATDPIVLPTACCWSNKRT